MKKKLFVLILIIILLIQMSPVYAISNAGNNLSGQTGDCNWTLSGTTLTISGNGQMGDYKKYYISSTNYNLASVPWADYIDTITELVVEEGVTNIGKHAFKDCSALNSVILASSVSIIGENAFEGCTSLSNIIITNGVTSIDEWAFSNCTSLKKVTIGENVSIIGDHAFYNCSQLTNINYNAISVHDFTQHSDVFYNVGGSSDGVNVVFGNNVAKIPSYLFFSCKKIKSISIGKNVVSIGKSAFYDCDGLSYIYYNAESVGDFYSSSSVFYNAGKKSSGIEVIFGENVVTIPAKMFYAGDSTSSPKITEVIIGSKVKTVGLDSFRDCTTLKSVFISDLSSWCQIDFKNNNSNPLYYAHDLYLNNQLVTDIVIPNDITTIEKYAFYNCTNLKSVTISESVESIGNFAFYNCNELTEVIICDIASWCNISFANSTSNPLYYAHNLYLNNQLVTDLIIPSNVKTIGAYAFYNCLGVINITIPAQVTNIDKSAFSGCNNLENIYYGGTEILWNSFAVETSASVHCDVVSTGTIVYSGECGAGTDDVSWSLDDCGTLTISGFGKMKDCTYNCPWSSIQSSIKSVVILDGVTNIGNYAFYYCGNLSSVTISNSVDSIGNHAFYNCNSLTSVIIPSSVISIGNSAFYSYYIRDIFYKGTWEDWKNIESGNMAFMASTRIHLDFSDLNSHGSYTRTIMPTCTAMGYDIYTCDCNSSFYWANYTPAFGHSYDDGICSMCGETITGEKATIVHIGKTIALSKSFDSEIDLPVWQISDSNILSKGKSSFTSVNIGSCFSGTYGLEITALKVGKTIVRLSEESTGEILASFIIKVVDHEFSKTETSNPTCITQGFTLHSCDCGYSYQDTFTAILSHDYSGEAIAHNDGTHSFMCTNGCNTFGNTTNCIGGIATCKQKAVCEECGVEYGDYAKHNLTKHEKLEPTFENDGNIEYWTCEECGKYFSDAEGKNEVNADDIIIGKLTIKKLTYLDGEVLIEVPSNAVSGEFEITVDKIVPPPAEIVEKVRDTYGESSEVLAYYEIRLFDGNGARIYNLNNEIAVKSKLPEQYQTGYVIKINQEDDDGNLVEMESWREGEYICYKTDWLEKY